MKKPRLAVAVAAAGLLALPGCSPKDTSADAAATRAPATQAAAQLPPGHPPVGQAQAAPNRGTVKETIDAGSYTYVRVEANGKEAWLAGPHLEAKPGDEVVYSEGMPMDNWHSDSLDRTWDQVLFVSELRLAGAEGGTSAMPSVRSPQSSAAAVTDVAVEKLAGGQSVAELYARRAELAGQQIAVRGKVVKANYGILGRNWLHLRDGSGSADTKDNDLTVTSNDRVDVGQVVSVKGTLALDKDFGAGYRYPIIVENAKLWVE